MSSEHPTYLSVLMKEAASRCVDKGFYIQSQYDSSFDANRVTITFNDTSYPFILGKTPFNSEEANSFVNDKWRLYSALREVFPVPFTLDFSKNDVRGSKQLIADIIEKIQGDACDLNYPIVIKPNQGSLSKNVFIAEDEDQLADAFQIVRKDTSWGDKILVQQYLGDEDGSFREIRGICFDGKTVVAFDRVNTSTLENASLADRVIWSDGLRIEMEDPDIIKQIDQLAAHFLEYHNVTYVAFDLKCDRDGRVWLIEGNVAPLGLEKIETQIPHGNDLLNQLTDAMLKKIEEGSLCSL